MSAIDHCIPHHSPFVLMYDNTFLYCKQQLHQAVGMQHECHDLFTLQGVIAPSVLNITASLATLAFSVSLSAAPSQNVQISIQSPTAAWNPSQALAAVSPSSPLTFTGADWNSPQQVSISPAAISVGDFFLSLTYRYSCSHSKHVLLFMTSVQVLLLAHVVTEHPHISATLLCPSRHLLTSWFLASLIAHPLIYFG